jgi:hypothetical protein
MILQFEVKRKKEKLPHQLLTRSHETINQFIQWFFFNPSLSIKRVMMCDKPFAGGLVLFIFETCHSVTQLMYVNIRNKNVKFFKSIENLIKKQFWPNSIKRPNGIWKVFKLFILKNFKKKIYIRIITEKSIQRANHRKCEVHSFEKNSSFPSDVGTVFFY